MDIRVGDELVMKKPHPCGGNCFGVTRIGADFKIRCLQCSREVMVPRKKVEKSVKAVYRGGVKIDNEELGISQKKDCLCSND